MKSDGYSMANCIGAMQCTRVSLVENGHFISKTLFWSHDGVVHPFPDAPMKKCVDSIMRPDGLALMSL